MANPGELIRLEGEGAHHALTGGELRLGRGDDCEIRLQEPEVSRLHAKLVATDEGWIFQHLSRANPSRVNGEIVPGEHPLSHGDQISLSPNVNFQFVLQASLADETLIEPSDDERAATSLIPEAEPATPEPAVASAPEVPVASPPEAAPDATRVASADHSHLHIAIVGAGPAGIAAAVQAKKRGVPHTLIERAKIAETIERYQKGKFVMDEPQRLPLQEALDVGFTQGSREEVLAEWNDALDRAGVNRLVGPQYEVDGIEGSAGNFELQLRNGDKLSATHMVLAIGVQGNLRTFGVEGDHLPHISYQLDDPGAWEGKKIAVVGVGDAGIENAVALAENDNEVSIVNRRDEFARAKQGNRKLILDAIKNGEITHYTNSTTQRFEEGAIWLNTNDGEIRLDVDLVIGRLGGIPPRNFLESFGVEFPSEDAASVPELSGSYESNIPGIHIVGALAGYPLIKNCMNQGFEVVEHIAGEIVMPADEPVLRDRFAGLEGSVSDILERIRTTLPVFSGLTTVQLREFLFDSELRRLEVGETIYERNDFTNTFFAIYEGAVEATKPGSEADEDNNMTMIERTIAATNEKMRTIAAGEFFGESGLISGRRRPDTVKAKTPCVVIEVSRNAMMRLIGSVDSVRRVIDQAFIEDALSSIVPNLPPADRVALAGAVEIQQFGTGEHLFQEGDDADGLHFIRRGSVAVTRQRDGKDTIVQYVQAGNYVGEMAVLKPSAARTNGARATAKTETMLIPAAAVAPLIAGNRAVRAEFEFRADQLAQAEASSSEPVERGTVMFLLDKTGAHEATDMLLIDESLCIRCDNCENACAGTHQGISRLNREAGPTYQTSNARQLHVPTACQHCENPKCMDDCPPDALRRHPTGEVYIRDNCIGCGNCETNCPYGVIQMAAIEEMTNPSLLMRLLFAAKPKVKPHADDAHSDAHAVKCDLCRDLPDPRGGRPKAACVSSCPTGALVRVDPRDLVNEIVERV